MNMRWSADGLVDEEDEMVITSPQEGPWLVANIGHEVKPDDADPSGGEGGVQLLGDQLAHFRLVCALHYQHVLYYASHAILHLVGHV